VTALVLKTDGVIPLERRHMTALSQVDAEVLDRPCHTEAELIAHGQGVDALLVLDEPVSATVVATLSRCRVISRFGIGVDTIDVEAATAAGIQVTNVPDASTEEVSDHALAMLLTLGRDLRWFDESVRRHRWGSAAGEKEIHRLSRLTLGLVGFGRIGRRLCEKALPLGLEVLAFDPQTTVDAIRALGAHAVSLGELLQRSDFVSLHAPLTLETRHILRARSPRGRTRRRRARRVGDRAAGARRSDSDCAERSVDAARGALLDRVVRRRPRPRNRQHRASPIRAGAP
jgi:D-3-phosphoglycerate dehydrogenase